MKSALVPLLTILLPLSAHAATWEWQWTPAAGDPVPKAEICPLQYGKTWAYAVEIDDNPASTLTVAQPLLANYQWNDAPPGLPGGSNHPFGGTAAVILGSINGGNSTRLDLKQIEQLKRGGWGIANHSYWHTGNHWDKTQFLKPDEFRRELLWSQVVYAADIGGGRAATHFVYPNGDFHYQDYLTEFGFLSSTRVGGSSPHNLNSPKANLLDWDRNYLDEGPWAGRNDALAGFPEQPQPGDFIIDFTHGIDKDPQSANQKRWVERLNHIAAKFGANGDNSMWVASSNDIAAYALAVKAARVEVGAGKLSITLPDTQPGSGLTLKLSGLGAKTTLTAPPGGALYRQGDTVWLTTPTIGTAGARPPVPGLKRIYAGEMKDLTWEKPVSIAGVRLRQMGGVTPGYVMKLDAVTPDGETKSLVPADKGTVADAWGNWVLYPVIPNGPALPAKALHVTPDKAFKAMEVWAVE